MQKAECEHSLDGVFQLKGPLYRGIDRTLHKDFPSTVCHKR